jgi:hypothetical protein
MLSVSGVSNANMARPVNFGNVQKTDRAEEATYIDKNNQEDSVEIQHLEGAHNLTKADKQEILKKARQTAAGWSIFGSQFSLLYFALRSDKTIAKKYDLDVEKDKKLINQIKRQQTLATLPSLVIGVGGLASYIYCKITDPDTINVAE